MVKAITINFIVIGFNLYDELYNDITNDFKNYAKENNLDIDLQMNLYNEKNITNDRDDYTSIIDILLKKKSTNNALYFFDPVHTKRYAKHFIDLKDWLTPEYLNSFSKDVYQSSVVEGQWVALVNIYIFKKYKIINYFL